MASSPAWQDITGAGFGMACPCNVLPGWWESYLQRHSFLGMNALVNSFPVNFKFSN